MKLPIKFIYAALLLGCMVSCTRNQKYSFSGDYESKDLNPTIIISNSADSTIKSENLNDGKVMLQGNLGKEGFHQVLMHYDDDKKTKFDFPIWLSAENLEFHFSKNLKEYPSIISGNVIQNDLSKYYAILNEESKEAYLELEKTTARAKELAHLRYEAFNELYYAIDTANQKLEDAQFITLEKFIKSKPSSQVLFYLIKNSSLDQLNKHPESYLALLKTLEPDFKDDYDYTDLVASLNRKLKVSVGNNLNIQVLGLDLNGDKFDPKILNNQKVILIEFWKAGNDLSRKLRQDYKALYKKYASEGFEIIGISLDKKENWWRTAVKDDGINWPQYSDLKGSESDNLEYYNIDVIPNNILITADGKILDINVPVITLGLDLEKFLK
jgi:peroxiredoxin